MINALAHEVTIEDKRTVETAAQMIECLKAFTDGCEDYLDESYVVESVLERLSDGSAKYSIRIRLAERV